MKIDTTQNQKLEFNVNVEGANLSELVPRLILKSPTISFLVEGVVSGESFVFKTPILEKLSPSIKEFSGLVEVLVRDRLVKVWEGTFEVDRPPVIKVTESKVHLVDNDKPVKITPVMEKTTIKTISLKSPIKQKIVSKLIVSENKNVMVRLDDLLSERD